MRFLKFCLFNVVVMILFTTKANAGLVHLLQANLFSWSTMDPKKNPPPINKFSAYVNQHNFDFITTQENDYALTDSIYKLNSCYAHKLVV
ncbi:hypothetical protein [Legionella sp. km772]|uniref:hypothetical protein n=1 Tax=Legionella sp. km772 TaxID=2498111 RepID=UPI0018F2ED4D|nr:hypothetical protein [Legionella sp. km772]